MSWMMKKNNGCILFVHLWHQLLSVEKIHESPVSVICQDLVGSSCSEAKNRKRISSFWYILSVGRLWILPSVVLLHRVLVVHDPVRLDVWISL